MVAPIQPIRGTVDGRLYVSSDGGLTWLPWSGSGGGGGGGAVTLADGADVAEGTKADAAATDSTSSWTVVALLKGLWAKLSTLSGIVTGGKAAVTIANGDDAAEGLTTDAKVTGDSAGTVSAKLRGLNYLLALAVDTANSWVKVSIQNATLAVTQSGAWVLSAGSAIIGKVGIDQTTPGTTNNVNVDATTGAGAALGATTGAAVITDVNGTIQQYLRGLVKLAITAGGFLVTATLSAGSAIIGKVGIDQTTPGTTNNTNVDTATGAGATIGVTSGAKVITDANGTVQQYLRGLVYMFGTAAAALVTATISFFVVPLTVTSLQVTASGDTVLLASGTRKLYRIKMSNSHATTAVTAGIKVPSLNGGATFDKAYLPAAGGLGIWTFPGGYLQTTSEAVSINLSTLAQVEVTAYYV